MIKPLRYLLPALCLALGACSSDPATFITYTQTRTAKSGAVDATQKPQLTDALALNYANSVEEIFRARATGSRYTRESSDTALAGLAAFTGAAKSLSISASSLSTMGLAGAGVLELRNIFDAKGRATAYSEGAERIHGAIKDYVAHNLNTVSTTQLTPNGWTLVNVVQANIDIVDKILNGHLPSPEALTQASEPMTPTGATPQEAGSAPVNNRPANSLIPTSANPRVPAAADLELQKAIKDETKYLALVEERKRIDGQMQDNKALSSLMLEIENVYPNSRQDADQAKQLRAAYVDLLGDAVLKDANLPPIAPASADIIRVFRAKNTTEAQRQKLLAAANAEVKKLKP